MSVLITLLGVPSVARDGAPVVLDTRKAMALIAHLALSDRPRSREALCDLLWPEHDLSRARGALRRTLSTVRSALGDERIQTTGDSIALRRGPGLEIDVDRFRELSAEGASPESLGAAAALFRGAFLEDFALRDSVGFEDWQSLQAALLSRELASVLRRVVAELTARGEHEQALAHARRWLGLDTLHEPAHRELIRLHALTGDRAAALEQYRVCVRTLSRELGVAPLQETADLYEQVNDGRLAPALQPAPAAPPAPAPARPPTELPLVGREHELAALNTAHAAAQPAGRLAVIEGEAGIGKTRLLEELARTARADGAIILATRCHDDEAGLPYGPVIDLLTAALRQADGAWADAMAPQRLADAALLLPELASLRPDVPAPLPLDGPGARVRLLEAVATVVSAACAGPTPGIVFVDDIHAADEATIDTIAYLARRLEARPLLLAVSWRSEALPPGHRLRRMAIEAGDSATIVSPRRLAEDEVATLVRETGHDAQSPQLARRIHLESEGLPLFVGQYLAGGAAAGDAIPDHVRGFLAARLAGLGAVARQVLGAAAAIGRSFDLETVRETSGRGEEELVGALEELLAHDVVREIQGPRPSYDFTHQKLRALVLDETSLARRRLLHRRVAAALSRGPGAYERAALVANHLRLAGDDGAAAAQYRIAAERAAELHAHADALKHLDAALALGDPDIAGAHERIGDLRTLLGDYVGALTAYGTAAAHAGDDHAPAAIEHKLGNVHHRRGEWERAQAHFAAALDAVRDDQVQLRSQIQADLAHTLHQAGRGERAGALAAESLALAQSCGDARAQAQAHNLLGVLARSSGDLDAAATELERSTQLAAELGDELAHAAALNNLALVRRDAGRLEQARELTDRALALCIAHGDRHREAALENNLADIHHALGDDSASMEHLKRAVAIFAEIEQDEATRLPEIWKLTSW